MLVRRCLFFEPALEIAVGFFEFLFTVPRGSHLVKNVDQAAQFAVRSLNGRLDGVEDAPLGAVADGKLVALRLAGFECQPVGLNNGAGNFGRKQGGVFRSGDRVQVARHQLGSRHIAADIIAELILDKYRIGQGRGCTLPMFESLAARLFFRTTPRDVAKRDRHAVDPVAILNRGGATLDGNAFAVGRLQESARLQIDGHAPSDYGLVGLRQRLPRPFVEQRQHVTQRLPHGLLGVAAGKRLRLLVHVPDHALGIGRDKCLAEVAQHDMHAIDGHDGAATLAHQVGGQQSGEQEERQARQVFLDQLEAIRWRLPIVDKAQRHGAECGGENGSGRTAAPGAGNYRCQKESKGKALADGPNEKREPASQPGEYQTDCQLPQKRKRSLHGRHSLLRRVSPGDAQRPA